LPLFCAPQLAAKPRGGGVGVERGGGSAEIKAKFPLRICCALLNFSTQRHRVFVCVCGLEIPKVPVSFFVLHVAQIFDRPCQRGAFFYTYICLGIYLEKIFTHLANYLLIRPLKLPEAKKMRKKVMVKRNELINTLYHVHLFINDEALENQIPNTL